MPGHFILERGNPYNPVVQDEKHILEFKNGREGIRVVDIPPYNGWTGYDDRCKLFGLIFHRVKCGDLKRGREQRLRARVMSENPYWFGMHSNKINAPRFVALYMLETAVSLGLFNPKVYEHGSNELIDVDDNDEVITSTQLESGWADYMTQEILQVDKVENLFNSSCCEAKLAMKSTHKFVRGLLGYSKKRKWRKELGTELDGKKWTCPSTRPTPKYYRKPMTAETEAKLLEWGL